MSDIIGIFIHSLITFCFSGAIIHSDILLEINMFYTDISHSIQLLAKKSVRAWRASLPWALGG